MTVQEFTPVPWPFYSSYAFRRFQPLPNCYCHWLVWQWYLWSKNIRWYFSNKRPLLAVSVDVTVSFSPFRSLQLQANQPTKCHCGNPAHTIPRPSTLTACMSLSNFSTNSTLNSVLGHKLIVHSNFPLRWGPVLIQQPTEALGSSPSLPSHPYLLTILPWCPFGWTHFLPRFSGRIRVRSQLVWGSFMLFARIEKNVHLTLRK